MLAQAAALEGKPTSPQPAQTEQPDTNPLALVPYNPNSLPVAGQQSPSNTIDLLNGQNGVSLSTGSMLQGIHMPQLQQGYGSFALTPGGQLQALPLQATTPLFTYPSVSGAAPIAHAVSGSYNQFVNPAGIHTFGGYQLGAGIAQVAPNAAPLTIPMAASPGLKQMPLVGYGGVTYFDPHSTKVKSGVSLTAANRYAPY